MALLVLAAALGGCSSIVFSPDGRTIAFPWIEGKSAYVAVVGTDGGGFKFIPGTQDAEPLAWSPAGDRLLVRKQVKGQGNGDLVLVNLISDRSRKLASRTVRAAIWTDSPNRIIFGQEREGGGEDLVWFDIATGRESQRVSLDNEEIEDGHPLHWLRTYDGVAYLGRDKNAYVVWRGEVLKITSTGDVVGLAADRSGKKLMWARKSKNPRYILVSLYQYDLSDRTVKKLDFPNRVANINPEPRSGPTDVAYVRFSPRLDEFVLVTQETKSGAEDIYQVFRVDITGRQSVLLQRYVGKNELPLAFDWSPEGGSLALLDGKGESAFLRLSRPAQPLRTLRTVKSPPSEG